MNDNQDLQLASEEKPAVSTTIEQPIKIIHIDRRGFLSLTRKSYPDLCFCPYASKDMTIRCGTWCPMFGEPEFIRYGAIYRLCLTCNQKTVITANELDDARQ